MSEKVLTVSPSPHIHKETSVSVLMYRVILALMPAFAVSLYYFGIGALIVTITAILSCVLFEWLIQKYILHTPPTIKDGSAILTGLLLAFCLPANLPFWMVIIGSLVAIGVGKMTFGGLGNNPFNPALVGRVFLFISFPTQMSNYPIPLVSRLKYVDAQTGSTVLSKLKEGLTKGETVTDLSANLPSSQEMFMGYMGGSLGEIAAIALLIGFIYLLIRKVITWHIPVTIILSVFLFTGILWWANPETYADPLFHLLSGGLLLGAIYMATDYVTSPMSRKGMIIYALGIGILTVIIRSFGAYPEGVQFAILIMNAFVPLINNYIKPKRFGVVKND